MSRAAVRHRVVRAADDPHLARDLPPPSFLSPQEARFLSGLTFPVRRRKWLLGRFAAKGLLLDVLGQEAPPPARVSVLNEDSGAPYAEVDGARLPWTISISHREDLAAAAVVPAPHGPEDGLSAPGSEAVSAPPAAGLGIDLELVVERDPALVGDFFTEAEQAQVAALTGRARVLAVARIWSAKEAVLKALGLGLRLDTRRIEVRGEAATGERRETPPEAAADDLRDAGANAVGDDLGPGWTALQVTARTDAGLVRPRVGWRDEGRFVLTLARLG